MELRNKYEIRGDTTAIFLSNRKGETYETLIDTEDLEKIVALNLSWHLRFDPSTKSYYAKATRYIPKTDENGWKSESVYLHMVIMDFKFENFNGHVDHINHNRLDNRKVNLRILPVSKNLRHRKGRNSNNKSGERNVCWSKTEQKYLVQLMHNGKNTCFGRFDEDEFDKAVALARRLRKELYGED